jgi:hypothetical protein
VRGIGQRSRRVINNDNAAPWTGESLLMSYCWATASILQPNFRIPLQFERDVFIGYVFAELQTFEPSHKRNNLARNK